MISWLLPILCLVLALALLFFGVRLLGRLQWLRPWARGTGAMGMLLAACGVSLFAYDLLSYRQGSYDELLANLSFQQTGSQSYEALLVDSNGVETRFLLNGDQWRLDARILTWIDGIPASPLYRLESVSGRYLSLEDEQNTPKSLYELAPHGGFLDAWNTVHQHALLFPFLDALYGSAAYLPMADGAIYSITLGQHGLIGRPLNEAATVALGDWH